MKDRSLEEINVLKLLICILSFISVCMALILFMLLPVLKDYKETSLTENSQVAMLNAVKAKLGVSEGKVLSLRNENNKSLEQFEQSFNTKVLEKFLQNYFQNVKIKENKISEPEKYLTHSLTINASMKNPKNLYDFIDALPGFDYLIRIDYPLNLKATKNGIELTCIAKIYSANP